MGHKINYKILSDTHLGHSKLVKDQYRPLGFEARILKNCRSLIHPKDVFICLGDVSFYNDLYWHEELLDYVPTDSRILILGNHDRRTLSWYYSRGWTFVCNRLDLFIYGYTFRFSHEPLLGSDMCGADINIHGHLHDGTHRNGARFQNQYLINIENSFAPYNLKTIAEYYNVLEKRNET